MNKFLELSTSPLMNLDHTYRYSGTKLIEEESLSQHIIDTVMLGMLIIDRIHEIDPASRFKVSESQYVTKAIYHDLEEVITGDVPRPLKYFDQATKRSLDKVASGVAMKLFQDNFNEASSKYDIWRNAKQGSEGFILKFVDTLVVAHKVIKEVTLLHNLYMLRVAHEVSKYLEEYDEMISLREEFTPEVIDYLRSVAYDAKQSMEDLISTHKEFIDEMHLISQSMI